MTWRRRANAPRATTRRTGSDGPELLEVWGPADEPLETWTVLPGTGSSTVGDDAPPVTPLPRTPGPAVAGPFTCIRLNCIEQGRPSVDERCPACGHGTALLRDYRWPRTHSA